MSIYSIDKYLFGHLIQFLTLEEQYTLYLVNKTIKSYIRLPKNYGKILHFNKLKKHYTPLFLINCVQNYVQATILYNNFSESILNYYIPCIQCKKTKNIFRKLTYKSYLLQPKAKLLRVL